MNDKVTISDSVRLSHLPTLNGLRGISILIVLLSHLEYSQHKFYTYLFNGPLGVAVFFVISGFLITVLCLKEIENHGNISLRKFYIRRFFRIFPVAYLYIFVIFLLNIAFNLKIPKVQFWGSLLYLQNFSYFRSHSFTWYFGHLWSLAVEEQFYLLFPFLLKKNFKLYFASIIGLIFLLPLVLFVNEEYFANHGGIVYGMSHFFIKFQGIAVGCLAAVLAFNKKLDFEGLFKYKTLGNIIAVLVIWAMQFNPNYSIQNIMYNLIIYLLIAYLLITNIRTSASRVFRFLNMKQLVYIGTLSYSLYIWQQIFTSKDSALPSVFTQSPWNLLLIMLVALVSYHYFERYFLTIKNKFSR